MIQKKDLVNVDCPVCQTSNHSEKLYKVFDHEYQTSNLLYWQNFCKKCDLIYLSPRPHITKINMIYPDNYDCFMRAKNLNLIQKISKSRTKKRLKQMILGLGFKENDEFKLLDIGCGDGIELSLIKESFPNVITYGVEPNHEAAKLAKQNGHFVKNIIFEKFSTNIKYDIIYSSHVIEHVENPYSFINKMYKLGHDNSIYILFTPNYSCLEYKIFKKDWGGHHAPRHWTLLNDKSLSSIIEKNNFKILQIDDLPISLFWIWSIHSFLYRKKLKKVADFLFHPHEPHYKKSYYYFPLLSFFVCLDKIMSLFNFKAGQIFCVFKK